MGGVSGRRRNRRRCSQSHHELIGCMKTLRKCGGHDARIREDFIVQPANSGKTQNQVAVSDNFWRLAPLCSQFVVDFNTGRMFRECNKFSPTNQSRDRRRRSAVREQRAGLVALRSVTDNRAIPCSSVARHYSLRTAAIDIGESRV